MSEARAIAVDDIPVIDVATLGRDNATTLAVGHAMRTASETVGFFYVRNHGIPQPVIDRAFATSRAFFQSDESRKRSVEVNGLHRGYVAQGGATMVGEKKPDLKESFVWGLELGPDDPDVAAGKPLMGPNQWPDFLPAMRQDLYTYYSAVLGCGRRLLSGLAASLDRPSDFFEAAFSKPLARGGTIYYPPQDATAEADRFGVAPHTDYGGLTLLAQDSVGGLQVRSVAGEWVTAHPIAGTLVINVGDLMGRWTNDRFHSNAHRVVNSTGRERQSIAVFLDPHADTIVDPRDLLDDQTLARYPAVTCGEYIVQRFGKVFRYRRE